MKFPRADDGPRYPIVLGGKLDYSEQPPTWIPDRIYIHTGPRKALRVKPHA